MPRSFTVRLLLGLAVTAGVVAVCLCPASWLPTPRQISSVENMNLDKLVHFSMYATFGLAWMLAMPNGTPVRAWGARVIAAGAALAIGTELAQGIPAISRDPDVLDCLANFLGLMTTTLVAMRFASSTRDRAPNGPHRELARGKVAAAD